MCYVISCAPRVLVCRDVRAGNNDMWANAKTIKIVLAPLSSVLLLVVVEERSPVGQRRSRTVRPKRRKNPSKMHQ